MEPLPEPPFTVTVDGKVVQDRIRTRERAVEQIGRLALQHRGCRVQALDRYGREVAVAIET